MSSKPFVIRVHNLGKCYQIYDRPADRLKQFLLPRIRRWLGAAAPQYFREFWALKGVSFDIRQGETVGIIGRNGSGKSTLLQLVCGTLHPTHGQIEVNGRVAALLELGSGFNPEFTGRENVYLNAGVLGLTRQQTEARFAAIEAFADIGEFIEQPVKTYSSGMMVRLAFAVIAHVDADILVIDEALAVGDAFFTQKCMRFLHAFMKTGTILFVSHDTGSVRALCNKALWIEKGKVLQEGDTKTVCESYLDAFYEEQQGRGTTTRIKLPGPAQAAAVAPADLPAKDERLDLINASNLRNDLRVVAFDFEGAGFSRGGATITHVDFLNDSGQPLAFIVGGETVCLRVQVQCHIDLPSPIVGFMVKDRLAQAVFGDNTCITYLDNPQPARAGSVLQARFVFDMPRLSVGDYSIIVTIADGNQTEHVQHHWIHDAIGFRSETSSVASGIVGIPMRQIVLEAAE